LTETNSLYKNANIKAIVFDLGGVLLNVGYEKVSNCFKALEVKNFDQLYSQAHANPLFANLETGKITEEEFCHSLKKYADKTIADDEIVTAWNSILLDFRKTSLDYLKKLKNKYQLFLLSNTNIIHLKAFNKIFEETISKESFNSLFDKAYYSHEIGLRKPDAAAYLFVLNDNNLIAKETLFIDDTLKNIEGAKAVGMPTIFLEKEMKIEDLGLYDQSFTSS
jgi:epoxide hydrolase-like predicted phosphatase